MPTKYIWLIAGGALAVLGAVMIAWPHLDPPVRAAIISGVVTALAALLGASLLIWQIGTQARNAIAANRTTEALKLKKEVYVDIIKACKAATDAQAKVTSYIQRFEFALGSARSLAAQGKPITPPAARAPRLATLYFKASSKATELIMLQERWEIIDPRSVIFREAFAHAYQQTNAAWFRYYPMALRCMPTQLPDGTVLPWTVFDADAEAVITSVGDELRHGYSLHSCYIGDLQVEMQNALLGELFEPNQVPRRDPPDPEFRTVRLDRIPALKRFFADTPMGRDRERLEREADERYAATSDHRQ